MHYASTKPYEVKNFLRRSRHYIFRVGGLNIGSVGLLETSIFFRTQRLQLIQASSPAMQTRLKFDNGCGPNYKMPVNRVQDGRLHLQHLLSARSSCPPPTSRMSFTSASRNTPNHAMSKTTLYFTSYNDGYSARPTIQTRYTKQ